MDAKIKFLTVLTEILIINQFHLLQLNPQRVGHPFLINQDEFHNLTKIFNVTSVKITILS